MGKTAQIKGDLDDVEALLEIIQILKDVSTNRFFVFAQGKDDFSKFLEMFLFFFNMLESVETDCPLVRNNNPGTDIIIVSSEASFMSQLNSRVTNAAASEYQKNPGSSVICVGRRINEKCRSLGMKIVKTYEEIESKGRYEMALAIRDFLIDRMMTGVIGRVICIYIWPKNFNILKPRIVNLLPASELLGSEEGEGGEGDSSKGESAESKHQRHFIQESSIDGIMRVLSDIWVSSRLFEILSDTKLAEAAAQSQQLEQAMESLSKEKSGLMLSFKKAARGDLNKAMREVFTSAKIIKSRRR